ncbi:hypothetical protein J4205_03835 [Candidatus Pacearchaeota archaeon]|nr:hypothetical protein [Candidatus Pacearchaeota archaeon]
MISKKVVYGGIFAASVFAGAVGEIILPGYGKDIAYSIQSYTGCRFVGFDLNPLECATVGFVSSSAGEFSQYLGLFPGNFDHKDFFAYAAGSIISFGIEKFLRHQKSLENLALEN